MTKNTNANTKSSRFDGRKTIAKGFYINLATQVFKPFERVLAYTRSVEKAVQMIQQTGDVPADCIVTVTELQNERPHKTQYNNELLFNLCEQYNFEQEASKVQAIHLTQANNEPYTVVEFAIWRYEFFAWMKTTNDNGKPEMTTIECNTWLPCKYTKRAKLDMMKAFVETNYDNAPICVYPAKCEELKAFAVISESDLMACKVPETR